MMKSRGRSMKHPDLEWKRANLDEMSVPATVGVFVCCRTNASVTKNEVLYCTFFPHKLGS